MFTTIFQRFIIGFGVVTALGILVHDTKFDQAITLSLPVAAISFGMATAKAFDSGDAHTHVERASVSRVFNAGMPRVQGRDDRWSYVLPKIFSRGNLSLAGSQILWPSV